MKRRFVRYLMVVGFFVFFSSFANADPQDECIAGCNQRRGHDCPVAAKDIYDALVARGVK